MRPDYYLRSPERSPSHPISYNLYRRWHVICNARMWSDFSGVNAMVPCKRLRIDDGDGSSAVDYRIKDDMVEMRVIEISRRSVSKLENGWRRLTMEQISAHLESNTVVAQWLKRRMGVHRLLRACTDFRPTVAA
jgi:hypothetical protein